MNRGVKAWQLPPRLITGAYFLNAGLSKRGADEATAGQLHGFATGTYPFLGKLDAKRFGAVASAVTEPRHADCRHDNSPPRSRSDRLVCLRWLLLSTRHHRAGSALVPTLRAVVSRRRGAAHRTRDPGRPLHHLPMGAAVHAAAGRGRPALPPRGRGPLVGR